MNTKLAILMAGTLLAALPGGMGQSIIQFSANSFAVSEGAGTATLSVLRSNDVETLVSVNFDTADGTAASGLRYTATHGTLTFAAGQVSRAIAVPILNNGILDGTRSFSVTLSNPTNAVLGTRTTATVPIIDNDVGISFQFAAYTVAEDAGAVWVGIVRGDDGSQTVAVDVATTGVTAISGLDFAGITNTLTLEPAERLKFISVPIFNNNLKQPNRSFRLTLSNPSGGTLGNTKTATVTIQDRDPGVRFESGAITVAEDAGAALLKVLRGGDPKLPATVDFATADGTAIQGLDYFESHGTLPFAPGEKVKWIPIPILNDGDTEPDKTFQVTLSHPTGDAELGLSTTTAVTILDNDPGLGFEQSNYSVGEKERAAEIALTVVRGNDRALGRITVDYATADGSAAAGKDYQPVSGTLEFQEGETVKTITVPILRPASGGGTSFLVTLRHPTGGASLAAATATVSIMENHVTLTAPVDARLVIRREQGVNVLTWTGGGKLQRADRVTGPWQTLAAALSPWPVDPSVPVSFYRVGGIRPVSLYVPPSYDGQNPMPLLIALHGYTTSGQAMENWFRFQPLAAARGFLYCYPDGTVDRWGNRFWNGTDAAGDFGNTGVDDAGYLRGLVEEVTRRFRVDRKRVYLVGYSNGGFMAYRMACEWADVIAGIASVAGSTFLDPSQCQPSQPVNILNICGTADEFGTYKGGADTIGMVLGASIPANMPAFPGAVRTVQTWAESNGASDPITETAPSIDLVQEVPGLDTVVTRYVNSPPGGAVELWTINGGGHVPTPSPKFSPRVIDWLLAHPKP